ncbi:MAG: hypothetical protein FD149_2779, partial [Rhodospirillaceae bacterium]
MRSIAAAVMVLVPIFMLRTYWVVSDHRGEDGPVSRTADTGQDHIPILWLSSRGVLALRPALPAAAAAALAMRLAQLSVVAMILVAMLAVAFPRVFPG